jgi:hypothetical protein
MSLSLSILICCFLAVPSSRNIIHIFYTYVVRLNQFDSLVVYFVFSILSSVSTAADHFMLEKSMCNMAFLFSSTHPNCTPVDVSLGAF